MVGQGDFDAAANFILRDAILLVECNSSVSLKRKGVWVQLAEGADKLGLTVEEKAVVLGRFLFPAKSYCGSGNRRVARLAPLQGFLH